MQEECIWKILELLLGFTVFSIQCLGYEYSIYASLVMTIKEEKRIMGLLDKMIKKAVKEVITDTIEKHTGLDLDGSDNENEPSTSENASSSNVESSTSSSGENDTHSIEYFQKILEEEFSKYELKKNIPVSELGGEGRPYEFGLCDKGKLVGVIALVPHNGARKAYYLSKEAAAKAKVKFTNFYLHMANERDYVISRIKSIL